MSVAGDLRRRVRTLVGLSTVPTSVWDRQFASGVWDMLEEPAEAAHYQAIASFYDQFCSGSVLDIGCGIGTLRRYLPQARDYCGIDVSPVAVAKCRERFPGDLFEVRD